MIDIVMAKIQGGRWEVERDDGDDAVGWGHSYAYYECVDGVWVNMNREFTRCCERITPESHNHYHQDIAAITGEGDQGSMLVCVRKLPDPEPGFIPDNGFRIFSRGYDRHMHEDKRLYPKKPRTQLW